MFKHKSARPSCSQGLRKFESLEVRRLLTTFNVTTTIDRLDMADVTLAHPKGFDGKLSLREAIYLANLHPGADTVALKANSTYKITIAGAGEDADATGDFDVTDDLTIKGSGTKSIIDGNGLDRVFDIPSGNDGVSLTLNQVIVTGGIARGNGGGVAGESDSNTLTFINTTIKNNITTSPDGGRGGGVYSDSGDVVLMNSHVDNNSAGAGVTGLGGGIYIDLAGGITIKNSTVNSNSAYSEGGGVYIEVGTVFNVTNSQINNNHSGDGGGGGADFKSETPITITGSTFSGNTTLGGGGAINSRNGTPFTITRSMFSGNSATSDGGALLTATGTVSVTNSTFANNTSTGGAGGALANVGALTVTDSSFTHNVADGVGGAIDQELTDGITILRSTFTKNASLTDAGGAVFSRGAIAQTISVTDSKFTYNSAVGGGGAIQANGTGVIVLRSTFDHNTASDGNGGAIDEGNVPHTIDVTDSTFTYNTAKADGGAFNCEGGRIFVTRCLISGNTATNGVGGGFADEGSAEVDVTDSTISGNTAGGSGGGFTATGSTLTMSGSTVSGNRSGSEGGGMYVLTLDDTEITNCTISGNGAAVDGGGVAIPLGVQHTVRFINDTIAFNVSATGGGIFNGAPGTTDIVHLGNTIVAKNIATNGPDVFGSAWNDEGHNLIFSLLGSTNLGSAPGDIVGQDPLLGPLANNGGPTKTHALLKGSPAINNGDDTLAPDTDQRGVKRPQGSHSDIGAYEKK